MAYDGNETSDPQRDLFLWMHGHDTTPSFTFFTSSPPFSLTDLQTALVRAVKEISLKWDPQLECMFGAAKEEQHSIQLNEDDFLVGRVLAVDDLMLMGEQLTTLNRERVVQLLEMCRDEIQWESNEIRRLEVHCDNAKEQKSLKIRDSFQYRPLPRKERDIVPGIGVVGEKERRESGSPIFFKKEEDDDEEMLEADEEEESVVKKEEQEDTDMDMEDDAGEDKKA